MAEDSPETSPAEPVEPATKSSAKEYAAWLLDASTPMVPIPPIPNSLWSSMAKSMHERICVSRDRDGQPILGAMAKAVDAVSRELEIAAKVLDGKRSPKGWPDATCLQTWRDIVTSLEED